MATVAEHWGFGTLNSTVNTREFTCGFELEIEDIKEQHVTDVHVTQDHSLRNNGLEFISKPVKFQPALELFDHVHSNLKLGPNPFSERTSIHVHTNCLKLELNEVRQLILLYALYEPLFFNFVGDSRKNNIFCVPLNYTYLPSLYKNDVPTMHKQWHKYTAFNICPLGPGKDGSEAHGTIEFRHMYGTKDPQLFKKWLQVLRELYTFVEANHGFDIIDVITNGYDIAELARSVIPTFRRDYMNDHAIRDACRDSVIDVKLSAGGITK